MKEIELKDQKKDSLFVHLVKSNATYVFKKVPNSVIGAFKKMLDKGAGFKALRYLQNEVGKGTKVENKLADQIKEAKEEAEELLARAKGEEKVVEVFGPIKIMCDTYSCMSNTNGQCQASSISVQRRECNSYRAKNFELTKTEEVDQVQNVKTGDTVQITDPIFYQNQNPNFYNYLLTQSAKQLGFVKKVTNQYIVADFGDGFPSVTLWYENPWEVRR